MKENSRLKLSASRRDQLDMFVADILDVSPKGDINTMENPVFSLSTKPDLAPWRYENGEVYVEVMPSPAGRPTIFDKDILMYCISQVVEGMNRGRPVSRRVQITAHDLLVSTGRGVSGRDYQALLASMKRLRGVTITTNVGKKGAGRRAHVRGLIDSANVVEKDDSDRMVHIEVELSEWIMDAITNEHVLTYHPSYYQLRKPNERRMYELCRKFCGSQPIWEIGYEKLYTRFGTRASTREFRRTLKTMIREQNIPNYFLDYHEDREVLVVMHRPGKGIGKSQEPCE